MTASHFSISLARCLQHASPSGAPWPHGNHACTPSILRHMLQQTRSAQLHGCHYQVWWMPSSKYDASPHSPHSHGSYARAVIRLNLDATSTRATTSTSGPPSHNMQLSKIARCKSPSQPISKRGPVPQQHVHSHTHAHACY